MNNPKRRICPILVDKKVMNVRNQRKVKGNHERGEKRQHQCHFQRFGLLPDERRKSQYRPRYGEDNKACVRVLHQNTPYERENEVSLEVEALTSC